MCMCVAVKFEFVINYYRLKLKSGTLVFCFSHPVLINGNRRNIQITLKVTQIPQYN